MNFNIETSPEKYFIQLVEILKVLPPFNTLRLRQRQVFAEILYYNHRFSDNTGNDEIVNRLTFDFTTKEAIATKLGISKANLYNIYNELRQANLLQKDAINPKYKFKYLQYPNVTFTFQGTGSDRKDL